MKLEFSRQGLEKYSNIRYHGNSSSGSRVVPCSRTDRQTDRHDEASSRFSQFCEERLESKIEAAQVALLRTIVLALSLFVLLVDLGFVNACFLCTAVYLK